MILFLDGGYALADRSAACVESIREYTQGEEFVSVKIEDGMDWERVCRYLEDAQAIVLAADVYLDSVSSAVLRFLERVERAVINGESIGGRFYAVLYTELYEGEQTSVAMGVLKNFCVHANIVWGRGLGIGGCKTGTTVHKRSLWNFFYAQGYVRKIIQGCVKKGAADFKVSPLQEHALFIREGIQGTDVYINPKEMSRKGYIRKMNQEMKKINRAKIAQNL